MQKDKHVIIVGAGLVGSLWAVFLARRGYRVDLYERRPDVRKKGFIGGRSINLALSDRGWKALEKIGAKAKVKQVGIPMRGRMMHDEAGRLTFQPYGREDQAIYSVSRGGLNIELMNIAGSFDNVRFFFNRRCEHIDLEANELHFINEATGAAEQAQAPLIFGADGAFSALRWSMQRQPGFNYSQQYLRHGYKELTIPPGPGGNYRIEKNALHIWPRGQFMLIALPNLDGSFTCTLFLPFEGEQSFDQLRTPEAVQAFFGSCFGDAVPLMPGLQDDFFDNPTSSLVTIRCSPWHHQDDVLLIGDASHAIVPFYGQGMNSGFEDCSILDDMMDTYEEDWSEIIPVFGRQRPDDTNAIADLALRNFIEMRDLVADPDFLLRKKIAARLHDKFPRDFLPVYSMVTFSHLPYHLALEESASQDALFREILAIPEVEAKWDGPEVEAVFRKWLEEKKTAEAIGE